MVNANLGMGYDMNRRFEAIERALRDLSTQPILLHASTGQDGGQGLTTDTNGLHLFNPSGVEDITLATADGSANFNGNVNINGNLSVPIGSITNAALQAPVSPLATHAGTNNFGLATGANVELLRATISVPSGYTRALVYETATMHAWNNNTSPDDGYLTTSINGAGFGASSQTTAAAGGSICIPSTGSILLTSLGATFYVSALASSGSLAWAVNSNNFVNLDVMTIFLR
jgi:hypothetical protein